MSSSIFDESGFAHDMPRTHGYAPIGKQCHGVCNWHAKGRINVIGALIGKCLRQWDCSKTISMQIPSAGLQICCQNSRQNQRLMDNATFHKCCRIFKMQSHKPDIRLNIYPHIHQILTPLSTM
ncbi:MAG: transposase [Nitrosomonas sp.]|nr:transposase [Nitrosomonas sp.]